MIAFGRSDWLPIASPKLHGKITRNIRNVNLQKNHSPSFHSGRLIVIGLRSLDWERESSVEQNHDCPALQVHEQARAKVPQWLQRLFVVLTVLILLCGAEGEYSS